MSNLEQVVRPFQLTDTFTSKSLPPTAPSPIVPPDAIVFEWGDPSELHAKAIGIHDLNSGVFWKEVSRKTSTKRVFNPTDPTQFVDVQRMDQVKMKDELGKDHTLDFANPA